MAKCTKCKDGIYSGMPDFIGSNEVCTMSYCDCEAGWAAWKRDISPPRKGMFTKIWNWLFTKKDKIFILGAIKLLYTVVKDEHDHNIEMRRKMLHLISNLEKRIETLEFAVFTPFKVDKLTPDMIKVMAWGKEFEKLKKIKSKKEINNDRKKNKKAAIRT